MGKSPELFADSAQLAEELGAYSIDLNMGCPVKKITSNKSGSYLMTDMPLAEQIIKAVKKAVSLPVSVKFRKGWDNSSVNAVEFAKMCADCGAAYLTVHGRTRSDFYSGLADWEAIAAVKQAVDIPVVGNGDINSPQKAKEMIEQTGVDGVMIGRAALGHPWLIAQTHEFFEHGILPQKIGIDVVKKTLLAHIKGLEAYYGDKLALALSRKYVCWYCKNLRDARKFRETYVRLETMPEALREIDAFFTPDRAEEED